MNSSTVVQPSKTARNPAERSVSMPAPPPIAGWPTPAPAPGPVRDRFVHPQPFEDADPALVTYSVTNGAAASAKDAPRGVLPGSDSGLRQEHLRRFDALAAFRTNAAHEALGQNGLERGTYQEGLHSEIGEPRDGASGVIGVQCAQHEMPVSAA